MEFNVNFIIAVSADVVVVRLIFTLSLSYQQQPEFIRLYRKHSAITQIELKSINEEMKIIVKSMSINKQTLSREFGHTFIEARSAARRTDEMHSLI